jgi:periplasmic protein TonB
MQRTNTTREDKSNIRQSTMPEELLQPLVFDTSAHTMTQSMNTPVQTPPELAAKLATPATSINALTPYGAPEIKNYIQQSTWRGFTITVIASALLLFVYSVYVNMSAAKNTRKVVINKMKLTQLPPPPTADENTPPPPPPPTTIAGPAARAGTPIPVPDALVTPDMKDFASVEDVSRASTTGGDGDDKGFLGLSKDVEVEVRENEPDAYDFVSVEKEPYIDLGDLQKRIVYPDIARRAGIEGKVNIRVLVGKNGKPKKFLIESSDSDLLNNAASQAVMSSIFTPAILANQPIDCWVSIPLNFKMK